jgi:hypothetical protein
MDDSERLMARYGTHLALFGDGTVKGSPLVPDRPDAPPAERSAIVLDATPPTATDRLN